MRWPLADLKAAGIASLSLTGATRDRASVLEAFARGEASVFLLSLKAGGVGLTLTEADTVILYDPWWKRAVERQVMDRAHRIGQTKPVFVHRLVAAGTVEEKMLGIDQKTLAGLSGLSTPTIQRMEAGPGHVRGVVDSLTKVVEALDKAGVELIGEGAASSRGGRGVRLKPDIEARE
ncbi:helix-turn-helix domain-containing protein [Paracoccus ravus]|uniref:helix-turn-helix domain-containing protein n=1 Tax=Paracoccus ravus TaxID=2447760 RepID=UPI001FD6C0EF|nr:C-terminal helicase domain-containing protein [Paracoccus ravus]